MFSKSVNRNSYYNEVKARTLHLFSGLVHLRLTHIF